MTADRERQNREAHAAREPGPGESPKERVDRELTELLEEIRVILPGVEILFGFLIILPFQFSDEIAGFERIPYLGRFSA